MTKPRVRLGVIGCGMIAQLMHLPYARQLNDRFEIAALCDSDQTVVESAGNRYGIEKRYIDEAGMFAREHLRIKN